LLDLPSVKVSIEGRDIRMATLADVFEKAGEASLDVSAVMIAALEQDIWPESLVRNHPTLTSAEQIRLLESKAVVVGLGGLGGYLALLLARTGVGHLTLVDGDRFDGSNLNRQTLCTSETIGENKASVAARQCRMVNPAVKTQAVEECFSEKNSPDILRGADVVLDGLDSVSARKILQAESRAVNVPFIHGAVQRWSGQTCTFMPGASLTMTDIYPGESEAVSTPSVLAPVVSLIASLQVQEAIRLLTGQPPLNAGRLVFIDGQDLVLRRITLSG